MAKPGRPRKPTALTIVGAGKKGDKEAPPEIQKRESKLMSPKKLTVVQQRLWDDCIEPAWWLQQSDANLAYIYVTLMSEYLKRPQAMPSTRIGEIRKTGSELHLSSSEQARLGVRPGEVDPAEKFFAD